ncbi:hypothetical protein HRbin40_00335 [bacterium HR40]|nr:hypothetical protein HRbin40_00335 [bacterium HR40]
MGWLGFRYPGEHGPATRAVLAGRRGKAGKPIPVAAHELGPASRATFARASTPWGWPQLRALLQPAAREPSTSPRSGQHPQPAMPKDRSGVAGRKKKPGDSFHPGRWTSRSTARMWHAPCVAPARPHSALAEPPVVPAARAADGTRPWPSASRRPAQGAGVATGSPVVSEMEVGPLRSPRRADLPVTATPAVTGRSFAARGLQSRKPVTRGSHSTISGKKMQRNSPISCRITKGTMLW